MCYGCLVPGWHSVPLAVGIGLLKWVAPGMARAFVFKKDAMDNNSSRLDNTATEFSGHQ